MSQTLSFHQYIARLNLYAVSYHLHTLTTAFSRPVLPKPQAHFKSQICSSAAVDTATRSSVHADTSKSSPRLSHLFLLLPIHPYQNHGVTAVGKALHDQSPACDDPDQSTLGYYFCTRAGGNP